MIQTGFLFLTAIMAVLVYSGVIAVARKTVADNNRLQLVKRKTLLLLAGWIAYVSAVSLTGILATPSLPPRVPLFLILPCFAFMVYFFRSSRFSRFIDATPPAWLVYTQSFRIIVELLLVGLYIKGLIPKAATIEGYNYEMVIGITAIAIGYLGYTQKVLPTPILVIWNCCGLATLAIIVFIMISHAYFPGIYTNPGPMSVKDFGSFPNTLLAGFLMPLAVFMHIFSLVKIRRASKS